MIKVLHTVEKNIEAALNLHRTNCILKNPKLLLTSYLFLTQNLPEGNKDFSGKANKYIRVRERASLEIP